MSKCLIPITFFAKSTSKNVNRFCRMARDSIESMSLPSSNWNLEQAFNSREQYRVYPYRVSGTGYPSSLQLTLRVFKRDRDPLCTGPVQGFKIMFHKPNEDPQVWKKYSQLSPETLKLIFVTPQLEMAMESIRKYSPEVRGCYFQSEHPLRYFRREHYTQRNCETECVANFTRLQCGCVKFSMPSEFI